MANLSALVVVPLLVMATTVLLVLLVTAVAVALLVLVVLIVKAVAVASVVLLVTVVTTVAFAAVALVTNVLSHHQMKHSQVVRLDDSIKKFSHIYSISSLEVSLTPSYICTQLGKHDAIT